MKRKFLFLSIGCSLILILIGCSTKVKDINKPSTVSETSSAKEVTQKTTVPTLFIHGYSGTKNSFGAMIDRLEKQGQTEKELVLTVSPEGIVTGEGDVTGKKDNPSIQVLFTDNKSHEWNQTEWIKNCLVYLRDTYQIDAVNLVGHSMGGVSSLRYLATYGSDSNLPRVEKFIGLGAPFNNFIELPEGETIDEVITAGPTIQSERYEDYLNGLDNIPTKLSVLLIAGDIEDGSLSDGTVPVTDAIGVFSLLKNHGNSIQYNIFYGNQAQHSLLHENVEVDQLVADFLWT